MTVLVVVLCLRAILLAPILLAMVPTVLAKIRSVARCGHQRCRRRLQQAQAKLPIVVEVVSEATAEMYSRPRVEVHTCRMWAKAPGKKAGVDAPVK